MRSQEGVYRERKDGEVYSDSGTLPFISPTKKRGGLASSWPLFALTVEDGCTEMLFTHVRCDGFGALAVGVGDGAIDSR